MIFYIEQKKMTTRREIITSLENLNSMLKCLQDNPGVFIIKLGAEWCGPCKKIESLVTQCMQQAPANVQCAIIDVDESLEIYSFLKTKRVINGIPAILGYYKGNLNYIPDDLVIGSDQNKVISFFQRCYKEADK
jgi:thiol-disulfide isomerase/thioredoxin